MSALFEKFAMRTVVAAFSTYGLYLVGNQVVTNMSDASVESVMGNAYVKAIHAGNDGVNERNVKYLSLIATDMALPYLLLALWASLRASRDFVVALGAALALVLTVSLTWKNALGNVQGSAETAVGLARQDALMIGTLLVIFLFSTPPKRQRRGALIERVWLHLNGYVGLCVAASIFVKPAGMWIVSLNNSATTNVAYHIVMTHVFWEAISLLTVALYASETDAFAFYVAVLGRVFLSAVTMFNNADHAPDVAGLSMLLLVEGLTVAFFIYERVRPQRLSRKSD